MAFTRPSDSNNMFLNNDLSVGQFVSGDINFVVFSQFLKQLKLNELSWTYSENWPGGIEMDVTDGLIVLDEVFAQAFDGKSFLNPEKLYRYYLLEQYLGTRSKFEGIGMVTNKKNECVILNRNQPFDLDRRFDKNELVTWILRNVRKSEIMQAHEAFFVLIDEKFYDKLLLTLTVFQSQTKKETNKKDWLADLINLNRLAELKEFSKKEILKL